MAIEYAHIGLDNGLGPNRRQDIIDPHKDLIARHIHRSLKQEDIWNTMLNVLGSEALWWWCKNLYDAIISKPSFIAYPVSVCFL